MEADTSNYSDGQATGPKGSGGAGTSAHHINIDSIWAVYSRTIVGQVALVQFFDGPAEKAIRSMEATISSYSDGQAIGPKGSGGAGTSAQHTTSSTTKQHSQQHTTNNTWLRRVKSSTSPSAIIRTQHSDTQNATTDAANETNRRLPADHQKYMQLPPPPLGSHHHDNARNCLSKHTSPMSSSHDTCIFPSVLTTLRCFAKASSRSRHLKAQGDLHVFWAVLSSIPHLP